MGQAYKKVVQVQYRTGNTIAGVLMLILVNIGGTLKKQPACPETFHCSTRGWR